MYIISAAIGFALAALVCPASAEPDFEPATRETDRAASDTTTRAITNKMRRAPTVSISMDESPDPVSAAANQGSLFVKQVVFAGMRSFSPDDLLYVTKKYTNRPLTPADMDKLAKEIELEYLKRGMVSVVFVPPQQVRDEILQIQVMEPDTQ